MYMIYGLHIRLPPYQPGSKVPIHTILIYGLHIRLPPYQPGSKVYFCGLLKCLNNTSTVLITL